MPHLEPKPSLAALQHYVSQLEIERGFTKNTLLQQSLMLGEEVGELFKAIRKQQNMTIDKKSVIGSVNEELADVLIYVCAIANRLDIDLEQAFRDKEELNKNRVWKTSIDAS